MKLTLRENKIFRMLCQGLSMEQISKQECCLQTKKVL
jgi:DNA-binding CsgD family transcriptional regulator